MVRLFSLLLCVGAVSARLRNPRDPRDRYYPHVGPPSIARSSADEHTYAPRAPELPKRATTISFANPKAAQYLVDGTKIPEVDFDVGPSWSGLMPISGNANETRKLFFWFWPTTNQEYTDDLVFWTNGGPGCSSLEGLLQENGPFTWPTGTAKPIRNQWAWTNLSHVLWVEQPVGTGFSQGIPNITNEDQLAAQFAGFLAQFLEVFSELKGKNFYATGESYAGVYVPYIANYLYENPKAVDLKLKGTWITDPAVSYDLVTKFIPALKFALVRHHSFYVLDLPFNETNRSQKWKDVLGLNSSFVSYIQQVGDKCGFTDYSKKYATYPPAGPLPLPPQSYVGSPDWAGVKDECATWSMVYDAAITVNPNFNIYRIFDVWPVLWDVLGFPGSFDNQQSPLYFNRTDVQDAIHAPHINWSECSSINVFVNGTDTSIPPMLSVMPNVIEKSERTVVMHGGIVSGLGHFQISAAEKREFPKGLCANGGRHKNCDSVSVTLASFVLHALSRSRHSRNMTWHGQQGFQQPIASESFIIEGFGILGAMHQERNLTYVEVDLSGHMMPQYAPWAAYKTLSYLLGREELTDHTNDAALYPSAYALYGLASSKKSLNRHQTEL
ncbi:Alpha beta-hydrolase [Rhizoctonia solani]|uniref:Alpha beta-hydrolase n=1 Tax=Rhizoctonia solani TaxID=456999 RepID=A0A8H7H1L3_9AGAM|nr:Alpha beta-hydrolase [Rhizoctonia solani]